MNNVESIRGSRELVPGQCFLIPIPSENSGRITVVASVRRHSHNYSAPAHYLLELFAPGANRPSAFREVKGHGLLSLLEWENATPGAWIARVTNMNSIPVDITIGVTFPGNAEVQWKAMPAHFLESIAAKLFAETYVHLEHGPSASRIRFAGPLGLPDFRFTVPSVETSIAPPLLPEIDLVQQVQPIANSTVRLRLLPGSAANPGGTLRLELPFDESGVELLGCFPVHLVRMKLLIELDLGVHRNRYTYSNVRTAFDFDPNVENLPVWLLNPLFNFQSQLRRAVEDGVREAFEQPGAREAFSAGVETGMEGVLGAGARPLMAEFENGQVRLGIYRTARAAVA